MKALFQKHLDQMTVYQLPAYSPDYNPIEFLWKKVKIRATHNRYFAEFEQLVEAVKDALAYIDLRAEEILRLMGVYTKQVSDAILAG